MRRWLLAFCLASSTCFGQPQEALDQPEHPEVQVDATLASFTSRKLKNDRSTSCNDSNLSEMACRLRSSSIFDELTTLLAFDGSKQPQDFGVNANAGLQASFNWGLPILSDYGVGFQVGSNYTATDNAVQVYELLGETTKRNQSFTTVGFYQRLDNGLSWGGVHDFLYQDSFDHFALGQWRMRVSYLLNDCNEVGVTGNLRSYSDTGTFLTNTAVALRPIDQGSVYWRRFWQTGAQTTAWFGIADEHGENNAVTGPAASKDDPLLFGADVLMPLTNSFAIFGEANMITPFDTGTVDAFLGLQWYPSGNVFRARRTKYAPMFSVSSPTNFSTDLSQ